jgi:hypothetical protein
VGNFVTLTSWRIPSKLCKLLFLQHQCNVNEHGFFSPMKDQNIQKEKCDNVLWFLKNSWTSLLMLDR